MREKLRRREYKRAAAVLITTWLQRSHRSAKAVAARAGMSYDQLYNRYLKEDRPLCTTPDAALALVRAFVEGLTDSERCTAREALAFFDLTQLPLSRFAEARSLFLDHEWQSAWQALTSLSAPGERRAEPAPARAALHQLRAPVSDFVGRGAEQDRIIHWLRQEE